MKKNMMIMAVSLLGLLSSGYITPGVDESAVPAVFKKIPKIPFSGTQAAPLNQGFLGAIGDPEGHFYNYKAHMYGRGNINQFIFRNHNIKGGINIQMPFLGPCADEAVNNLQPNEAWYMSKSNCQMGSLTATFSAKPGVKELEGYDEKDINFTISINEGDKIAERSIAPVKKKYKDKTFDFSDDYAFNFKHVTGKRFVCDVYKGTELIATVPATY